MSVFVSGEHRSFYLSGGNTSYVLHIDDDGRLVNLHWGARVADGSLTYRPGDYMAGASFDLPLSRMPLDLPCCGTGWYGSPSVGVRNVHGDDVTDLRVVSFRVEPGKPCLGILPSTYVEASSEADTLIIELEDRLTGLQVDAFYTVFSASGVIARSLNIRNGGDEPLVLTSVLSASVLLWELNPARRKIRSSPFVIIMRMSFPAVSGP